jgi:gamma-glutamyltranspeptidase/glutathione hydrolase
MWFDPRPDQPNSIAPGKRPLTNMLPVILKRDGRPWIAGGASGGRRIMASVFQTLTFAADFGMTLEDAAHFPRIDVSDPDSVSVDQRMPPEVIAALQSESPVEVVEHSAMPINFACPNLIQLRPDGTRTGISDAATPWSAAIAQ